MILYLAATYLEPGGGLWRLAAATPTALLFDVICLPRGPLTGLDPDTQALLRGAQPLSAHRPVTGALCRAGQLAAFGGSRLAVALQAAGVHTPVTCLQRTLSAQLSRRRPAPALGLPAACALLGLPLPPTVAAEAQLLAQLDWPAP